MAWFGNSMIELCLVLQNFLCDANWCQLVAGLKRPMLRVPAKGMLFLAEFFLSSRGRWIPLCHTNLKATVDE
jgi:hypothetical protein